MENNESIPIKWPIELKRDEDNESIAKKPIQKIIDSQKKFVKETDKDIALHSLIPPWTKVTRYEFNKNYQDYHKTYLNFIEDYLNLNTEDKLKVIDINTFEHINWPEEKYCLIIGNYLLESYSFYITSDLKKYIFIVNKYNDYVIELNKRSDEPALYYESDIMRLKTKLECYLKNTQLNKMYNELIDKYATLLNENEKLQKQLSEIHINIDIYKNVVSGAIKLLKNKFENNNDALFNEKDCPYDF